MSKKVMKIGVLLASVLFFLFLVVLFIPHYEYDQSKRSKASEMFMVASQVRSEISSDMLLNKPINVLSNELVSRLKYISYGNITQKGEILLFSEKLGAFMVMKPKVEKGEVIWTCDGQALKIMPYPCQGRTFLNNSK